MWANDPITNKYTMVNGSFLLLLLLPPLLSFDKELMVWKDLTNNVNVIHINYILFAYLNPFITNGDTLFSSLIQIMGYTSTSNCIIVFYYLLGNVCA